MSLIMFSQTAWQLHGAQEQLERASLTRTELLHQAAQAGCKCNGVWLECAREILIQNKIEISTFVNSILCVVTKGER